MTPPAQVTQVAQEGFGSQVAGHHDISLVPHGTPVLSGQVKFNLNAA